MTQSLVRSVSPLTDLRPVVQEAAGILRRGGLVVFPTETVYGLGADADNPEAVAQLRRATGVVSA